MIKKADLFFVNQLFYFGVPLVPLPIGRHSGRLVQKDEITHLTKILNLLIDISNVEALS
jgi:hypothetical protein